MWRALPTATAVQSDHFAQVSQQGSKGCGEEGHSLLWARSRGIEGGPSLLAHIRRHLQPCARHRRSALLRLHARMEPHLAVAQPLLPMLDPMLAGAASKMLDLSPIDWLLCCAQQLYECCVIAWRWKHAILAYRQAPMAHRMCQLQLCSNCAPHSQAV